MPEKTKIYYVAFTEPDGRRVLADEAFTTFYTANQYKKSLLPNFEPEVLRKCTSIAQELRLDRDQRQPTHRAFTLWAEGYNCTGDSAPARCLGVYRAKTFEEACDIWGREPENAPYYSRRPYPAYWGCRIFDNEADARKSFG